jgi:hypothetical protein
MGAMPSITPPGGRPMNPTDQHDPTGPIPFEVDADPTDTIPLRPTMEPVDAVLVDDTGNPVMPVVLDAIQRFAGVGIEALRAALWRFVHANDDIDLLSDLWDTAYDNPRATEHDIAAYRSERGAQLLSRIGRRAAKWGAYAIAVLLWWLQLGAHGLWFLILTVAAVAGALPAVGAAVAGWRHHHRPDAAKADELDHETRVRRGVLRLLPGGRTDDTTTPLPHPPERPSEALRAASRVQRPAWVDDHALIERRLKSAFKQLRGIKAPEDGTPLIPVLDTEWSGNGWRFVVELPEDAPPASTFIDGREAVAKAWKTQTAKILMTVGSAHPGILEVWVCDQDPLAAAETWSDLRTLGETNMWDGYVLGQDLYGRDVRYHPLGQHCITGGGTGSGKSVLQKLKVGHLIMDPHHLVVFVDPNGGEWSAYKDVAIYFGGADQMDDALAFVEWLAGPEIERRSKRLADLKALQPMRIPELKVYEFLARDIDEDFYGITVIIEEAPEVFTGPEGARWYTACRRINGMGRKYVVQGDYTFQIVTKEMMGTGGGVAIRQLVTTSFCGAVRDETSARVALGDDWRRQGMNPLVLEPYTHAGTFWAHGGAIRSAVPGNRLLFKANFTDDGEGELLRRRARELRQRVRPGLLPENWQRPGTAPKRSTAAPTVHTSPEPAGDTTPIPLDDLRRAVEVVEGLGGGEVMATAVIGELANRWPDEHGDVNTVTDLNDLLAPYTLRTKQPVQPDGRRPHVLRYSQLRHRLTALEDAQSGPQSGPGAAGMD